MNAKKMMVSLIPWVLFSFMLNRHGEQAAGIAAAAAAALGVVMILRSSGHGIKVIDVAGVVTFGLLSAYSFLGGAGATEWVADDGRGASTLVLGVIMLGSVAVRPFSEQYARESVPAQYWHDPAFRATNRRISALWGVVVLVMAGGHLLAGHLDPMSAPQPGARPVDLILNWIVPVLLILAAVRGTQALAGRSTQHGRDAHDVDAARTNR